MRVVFRRSLKAVSSPDDASRRRPMDEFAALAQRVVLTMDDVRGCLVLSRDGLVLGAFPEDQEAELKPAWLRFVNVGEARKGFVEFSDQLWAFVHRGPVRGLRRDRHAACDPA